MVWGLFTSPSICANKLQIGRWSHTVLHVFDMDRINYLSYRFSVIYWLLLYVAQQSTWEENICHYSSLQSRFSSKLSVLPLNKYVCKIVCVCVCITTKDLFTQHPNLHKFWCIVHTANISKTLSCSGPSIQLCSHRLQDQKPKVYSRDQTCVLPTEP